MTPSIVEADVVVIGAGLAGLSAARRLVANGRQVCVVEARDRVGGRVLNHTFDNGEVVEVGGQFVGPTQHNILSLAAAVGVDTFRVYDKGRHVVRIRGRRQTYRYAPRLSPIVLADIARGFRLIERQAKTVPLASPWQAVSALTLDWNTLEAWIRANLRTEHGRAVFALATEAMFAESPKNVSLLHALFFVHSAGGVRALTDVAGGAQESRFLGGSHEIARRVAEVLGDDRVFLSEPVSRIQWWDDGVAIDGRSVKVRARRAIVATPPAPTTRIEFDPALPNGRTELLMRLRHGSVVKANVTYREPWWREVGLSGQSGSDQGLVSATFDNTPPRGNPGVLLAFIEAENARSFRRVAPAGQREAIIEALVGLFGTRARSATDVILKDWDEPFTEGCYGANFPPGAWVQWGEHLRQRVGPLHWAGAETAQHWVLYMDGAVESGQRAADEVLTAMG